MAVGIRKQTVREEKQLVRKGMEGKIKYTDKAEGCSTSESSVESNEVEEGSGESALTKCV